MIQPSTAQPTTIATTVPPKKTLGIKAAIWGLFHLGVVSTKGSNTFRQAIRHPKEAEAKSLFNLSRLHAEGEKVYGFYSEEIHS